MIRRSRAALALATLLVLGGCQSLPTTGDPGSRAPAEPAAATPQVPVQNASTTPPPQPAPPSDPTPPPPPVDPWSVLRDRLKPTRCDQPRPQQFISRYAGHPERFQARVTNYAPILHYVATKVEEQQLPAEIALVPIVESTYQGYPGRGQRPAGMWQIIPSTARSLGLVVVEGNDQRLDTARSTAAALQLFGRLLDQFDQRLPLALAGYNAGDGRVARALAKHPERGARQLPLSRITLEYLDKVEALSCLFADPHRYGFAMPPLPFGAQLSAVELPYAAEASQLAAALRLDAQMLRRYNGAVRGPQRRPPGHRWLVPNMARDRLIALEPAKLGPVVNVVAAAHAEVHIVRKGDSLWKLSRQYGVSVGQLLQWNGLSAKSLLRIGQRLKLAP